MNFNPKDIFRDKKALAHYEQVANDVIERRGNPFMSNFVAKRCYDFFSKEDTPYVDSYGKLLGSTLNLFIIVDIENLLKSFQCEQIIFLKDNPTYLKRELAISLSISSLLLNEHFRRTELINGKSIIKLLWKGGKKLYKERLDRRKNEMMRVIDEPLSLLLNSYYYNNNQDLTIIDNILEDLISIPFYAWDNDELCIHTLRTIMDENLNSYFHKHIRDIHEHAESNKTFFPSLLTLLEKTNSFVQARMNELNNIEKEKYNHYRSQIKEWCSVFPASERSSNYEMVTCALSHSACSISNETSIFTPIDFFSSSQTHIEEVNNIFYERKSFRIPEYYIRIFKSVGEVVSYWNAFDANKNEKLEMDL